MTGLPSSVLIAGARSVIGSLWPVHDAATALMMESFYGNWAGGRGTESSPALALALSRDRLRSMPREEAVKVLGSEKGVPHSDYPFAHPFYADSFQCFGAW